MVCKIIENTTAATLNDFIDKTVSDKVELVATDRGASYPEAMPYYVKRHEAVDHRAKEYVRGEVHTNNIESFWALLKRGVMQRTTTSAETICRCISLSFNSVITTETTLIFSRRYCEDAEDAALEAASAVCQRWTGTEAGTIEVAICIILRDRVGSVMIFVVMHAPHELKIGPVIQRIFPNAHIQVSPGQWFVVASGTAQEVSNQLGITDGVNGSAIVASISGYYGRASTNIWEWLAANWNRVV